MMNRHMNPLPSPTPPSLHLPHFAASQDEQTAKLWEVHRYEHSRSGPANPVAYHFNSCSILDDTAYRVEFRCGW